MASDEHQQAVHLQPSHVSALSRDEVLDHFIRLVGIANDLKPEIEGLLGQLSNTIFWAEYIENQKFESFYEPEPPDPTAIARFRGLKDDVAAAIAALPQLAEVRAVSPRLFSSTTHNEIDNALSVLAAQTDLCSFYLDSGDAIPVTSSANPIQQNAHRLAEGLDRTFDVLGATARSLIELRFSHSLKESSSSARFGSEPVLPVENGPISVSISETPDWFLPDPDAGYELVAIIAADGTFRHLSLNADQALLFELLDERRKLAINDGWVSCATVRKTLNLTKADDPLQPVRKDKNHARKKDLRACIGKELRKRRLVRPATFTGE